ncbi:MAG: 30S ribosomal protein S13 [archaeon GB-1867-035]|nr:30S ribosomal protein S13 [Candidatus Culexmicrobium profundum]
MALAFRHIVRIAGQDVDGSNKVVYAISQIKGIGINLAHSIVRIANIDPDTRVGFLSDADIKRLENVIRNPKKYGVPTWMLNRRKDLETGEDLHLIGSDLVLRVKMDIDLMKKIKCWKGVRHALGLKVRGQRTRTTGRTGQTVGVTRRRR